MSSSPGSQDPSVSICIKLCDVPDWVHSLHIDIGKTIVIAYDKPSPGPIPEEVYEELKCWTCNRPGHFSRQCLSDRAPFPDACYECGGTDHFALHCHIPLRSPAAPCADTYVCMVHNKCRGKLNVFKVESGGYQCKPDSLCSDLV